MNLILYKIVYILYMKGFNSLLGKWEILSFILKIMSFKWKYMEYLIFI